MTVPRIVSAGEWLAERKELLAAEEQAATSRTCTPATRCSPLCHVRRSAPHSMNSQAVIG